MRVPALNLILSFLPCQCTVVRMEHVGTPMFFFLCFRDSLEILNSRRRRRKPNIFIRENNMLSSRVKISPLLWLHNKSRLSHQKTIKVKWFGISLVFI